MNGSPPLHPMEYAVGAYAPVDFMDLNAGSGGGTESNRLMTNLGATRSIQQRGMNEIQGANVTDERDWIRAWRKKIKETTQKLKKSLVLLELGFPPPPKSMPCKATNGLVVETGAASDLVSNSSRSLII